MIDFIRWQKFTLGFSASLVLLAILALIIWGITPGIDFTGGSLLHIRFLDERPDVGILEQVIIAQDITEVRVQPSGDNDVFIRLTSLSNNEKEILIESLRESYGQIDEKSFSSIGSTIGGELQKKALIAIGAVLTGIILYITWAFRKVSAGPVPAWFYGVGAIIALIHDILIPLGLYAVLGAYIGLEADTLFITALLTILGFSVHDTIVVYDRVRENLRKYGNETFSSVMNISLNETLIRSINTSLTALLVLGALFLFGGESIRYFVLVLGIGIAVGTYSSIYIAGPLLVIWARRKGTA
ncbi:MAG: protein translocase subunit SecF [Patescibacteria group bacterium]|jgi:preprotein translocase subunit SecF